METDATRIKTLITDLLDEVEDADLLDEVEDADLLDLIYKILLESLRG